MDRTIRPANGNLPEFKSDHTLFQHRYTYTKNIDNVSVDFAKKTFGQELLRLKFSNVEMINSHLNRFGSPLVRHLDCFIGSLHSHLYPEIFFSVTCVVLYDKVTDVVES